MRTYFQIAIGDISKEDALRMNAIKALCKANGIGYRRYIEGGTGRQENIERSNIWRVEICAKHRDWVYLDNDIELDEVLEMPEKKPYFCLKNNVFIDNFILSDNGSGMIKLPENRNKHWCRYWMDSFAGKCAFFDKTKYIHH